MRTIQRFFRNLAAGVAMLLLALVVGCSAAEARRARAGAITRADLPYPCALIKWFAKGKSEEQLRAAGKKYGVTLTARQESAAAMCLTGKFD